MLFIGITAISAETISDNGTSSITTVFNNMSSNSAVTDNQEITFLNLFVNNI